MTTKITKRLVDSAEPATKYYFLWDAGDGAVKGFGLKVNPNGQKVFVAQFRIGSGRDATSRRVTIGTYGAWTVETAREAARELIRRGNEGIDLRAVEDEAIRAALAEREAAAHEQTQREALRLDRIIGRFMDEHVRIKRKPTTIGGYSIIFNKHIIPLLGSYDAREISRQDIAKLHRNLAKMPITANRSVTILAAAYSWAIRMEILPDGTRNPCVHHEKFREQGRERYLTTEELSRLGEALRIAETVGIEWVPDPNKNVKHAPKPENRRVVIEPGAAAARRGRRAQRSRLLDTDGRHDCRTCTVFRLDPDRVTSLGQFKYSYSGLSDETDQSGYLFQIHLWNVLRAWCNQGSNTLLPLSVQTCDQHRQRSLGLQALE